MRKEITYHIGMQELKERTPMLRISDYFGINTFSEPMMRKMVSESTFVAFKRWQSEGVEITTTQADEIATAMKDWAISRGATAYCHWFQPMTGLTAEKHDSFISLNGVGQVLETFCGRKLILGEPDASSFPSGGLRATFEARGYTAWDPSSPVFVTEVGCAKTLCIPCIFISYTGEALDKKLPLLRSDTALSKAAVDLLGVLGNTRVKSVHSLCGPEQEYFLIDAGYFKLRPDLQFTGRTLFGACSPKGQQLEDQYFGSIKERILRFMYDVSEEAYKLGIPVATKHNEVAPHQFEFAPIYERSNIAADHNQLLMDLMKRVAKRNNLECLLHEKPFKGINGSGKHVNWSMADDAGNNLLNPGESPEDNLQFLVVLVSMVQAVYRHADLLRASVATAGNEHRLGMHEAPPAIISVFLGKHLTEILHNIEHGKQKKASTKDIVKLGVAHLPAFVRDTTDRNRTSPFAFTGVKFEFRAVGSSMNIGTPITVLNTIVADSLKEMRMKISERVQQMDFTEAVFSVLQETIRECKKILFEGNSYSQEWVEEARRRGLPNEPATSKVLSAFIDNKNIDIFESNRVFTKSELESRYSIWNDLYSKMIDIEGKTMMEMIRTQVLPSLIEYQTRLGNNLSVLAAAGQDNPQVSDALQNRRNQFIALSRDIHTLEQRVDQLQAKLSEAEALPEEEAGVFYFETVKPIMAQVTADADRLECIMPDDLWVLPKYREMLFIE